MMFRFDLHVHSYYSGDACDSPRDLVAAARARGLHGIAITDHDCVRVHDACLRDGLSRRDGTAVDGFLIVPGVEISTADGHLLSLGATPSGLQGVPAELACRGIVAAGGLAVPAHPLDHWRRGVGERLLASLPVQAVEVFNAAVPSKPMNERASQLAAERQLAGTAGSDAHHASAVGICHIAYALPELSLRALLEAIPRGGSIVANYLPPIEALKKQFANLIRLFRAPCLRIANRPE